MKIILRSIARWQSEWETICISKIGGAKDNRYFESPLKFWLKETPWMVDRDKVSPEFKPMDRWLIPQSTLLGRANHFKHLNPLPMEISWLIDSDPNVYEQLKKLGLPKYNPTIKSNSARLLNDLASSMTHPEEIANWDIFWGQVRTAWNLFEPNENDLFPQTLIVKTGTGLQAICPTEENPVYLPNDSSSIHYGLEGHIKNILAIDSKDAKRIESGFIRCFGNKIRLISDVKAQPLVNGKPWDENLAGELLCESEISWIIPVLLNCHAHAGNFARGPHTKSFSNAMATIRKARAIWVDSLQIGIWEGEQCYPVSNLSGIWLPKAFALLGTYEARNNPMALGKHFLQ
jgi:hypothetical protein